MGASRDSTVDLENEGLNRSLIARLVAGCISETQLSTTERRWRSWSYSAPRLIAIPRSIPPAEASAGLNWRAGAPNRRSVRLARRASEREHRCAFFSRDDLAHHLRTDACKVPLREQM